MHIHHSYPIVIARIRIINEQRYKMSSNKMSIKIAKSILLSTTFLVMGVIPGYNAPLASDFPSDYRRQFQPNNVREALNRYSEIANDGARYVADIDGDYTMEEKKMWVLDALNVLKNLTDYARFIKYYIFLENPSGITPVDFIVEEWDSEKKVFNSENFEFYLFTPTFKGMMAYKDIAEEEVGNIIKLLDLRLTRKATILNSYSDGNRVKMLNFVYRQSLSQAFEDGKLRRDRGELLSAIFGGMGEKIDEKNRFINFLQMSNKSPDEKFNDKNYKIKFSYGSSENIKQIKDIQSRIDKTWGIYSLGIKLLKGMGFESKQDAKNKLNLINNMKTKTLETYMNGIDTKGLFAFYLVLKHKIVSLENVNDYLSHDSLSSKCVEEINSVSVKFPVQELENGRKILIKGEEIHKDPSLFSLKEKQSWILQACNLLKTYESYVDDLMYGPFDLNQCTYTSWDDSNGSFIFDSLKIGTSFENDNTSVYNQLTDIDEWFIDQTILPKLLNLISKEHHENILWKQVKKSQYELQNLKTEEKPIPQMILEIYNIFDQNNRYSQINGQLLSDYICKNSFIKINSKSEYTHGHNDISEVVLEKSHSENRLKLNEKLDKLSGYAEECMRKVNVSKMLTSDRLGSAEKDQEKRMYQTFFIDFITQINANHTKEDIQEAYKIVTYQQELFYQFYALINSDLSKNSPVPVPLDQLTSKALNGGFSEEKKKVEPPKSEQKEELKVMFISAPNAQRETTRDRLRLKLHKQEIKKLLIESEEITEKANGYKAKSTIQAKDSQFIRSEAERKAIEEELVAKSPISSKKRSQKNVSPSKHESTKNINIQQAKKSPEKTILKENAEAFKIVNHNGKTAVVVQGTPMPKIEPKKLNSEEVKTSNVKQILPQHTLMPQSQRSAPKKQGYVSSKRQQNTYVSKTEIPVVNIKPVLFINESPVKPITLTSSVPEVIKAENKDHSWSAVVQNIDTANDSLPIVRHELENKGVMDNEVKNIVKTEAQNIVPNHNILSIHRVLTADDKGPLVCVMEKKDIQTDRLKVLIHPNPSNVPTNFFRGPLKAIFHIHHQGSEAEICDRPIISNDSKLSIQQSSITYFDISIETNPYLFKYDQVKFYVNETQSQLKPLVWDINAREYLRNVEKIVVEILPDIEVSPMQVLVLESKPEFKIMHWYQGQKK